MIYHDISIVSMGFNNQFIGDISIVSIYKPYIYNHIANGGHHQTFDHSPGPGDTVLSYAPPPSLQWPGGPGDRMWGPQ